MPTHHTIDYIEFQVTDLAVAQTFYGAAFGWTFTPYGPGYVGIQKPGGGEQGGLALVDSVHTGGPLVVLHSEDLPKTEAAVREAGGVVEKAIFDFPGGQRFEFLDPCGNRLAVWRPA